METKTVILDSFEYNSKEYYCEAVVTYSITIEAGDYDTPSSSDIDIEGVEIEECKVYNPIFNNWSECFQPSVIKAVTKEITNNFEL
jgi:hypothetical protein